MPAKPLLLAYDGSNGARHAIAVAGELFGGGDAFVVFVADDFRPALVPAAGPGIPVTPPEAPEPSARQEEAAQAVASEGVELAGEAGFRARLLVRHGLGTSGVAAAIAAAAEEVDAAAIVLGCRGRSPIAAAVLGSVAYAVVHGRTHPVLAVPEPA